MAEVSELDAGQSYCFMVAAYIPSRPKTTQQGAWSKQYCTRGHPAHGMSIERFGKKEVRYILN